MEGVGIEAHQRQVADAKQLVGGAAGVNHRAKQVEEGAHAQRLAHRAYGLHGGVEQLGVQVGDARLVQAAAQGVRVGGEADAVLAYDVARPADGRGPVVAVLRHLVARPRHHEAGAGGDVERILAVAPGAYDV